MSDAWQTTLVAIVALGAPWLLIVVMEWLNHRWWRRWELEDQLWRERPPDWQREAIAAADRTRAEVTREARRRLRRRKEPPA
jgi:hypothetical protein